MYIVNHCLYVDMNTAYLEKHAAILHIDVKRSNISLISIGQLKRKPLESFEKDVLHSPKIVRVCVVDIVYYTLVKYDRPGSVVLTRTACVDFD